MNLAPVADAELVARARRGDIDAFATLIQRYQPLATGVAALVMRNRDEAEDIAQEAFLKAYYALDRFHADASFRAWLMRIVVNEARNSRAAAHRRAGLFSRAGEELPRAAVAASAEEAAVTNEQRSTLLTTIDGLREDDRAVLLYRYVFDLSEAEMAEALGCSPGTVKSRLSRSLSRLRNDVRRVAPLLLLTPDFTTLVGQTLSGAAPAVGVPSADFVAAVRDRLAGGASAGAHSGGGRTGRPSPQQLGAAVTAAVVVALAAAGALFAAASRPATPALPIQSSPVASPLPAPTAANNASRLSAPAQVVAYGADLTDSQRKELEQILGPGDPLATETVSHEELLAGLAAAGLPVDSPEQATSSAAIGCLPSGGGLRVRTENITRLPAAAYANALVTAGLADAAVVVAAPPSAPMTGETALLGVLKAYPHCQSGQQPQPERVRLAYDQLRTTVAIGVASGAWDRAAAVMLRSAQAAIGTRGPAAVTALGTAVDEAAAAEEVPLEPAVRSEVISVLARLAQIDHGPYAHGYTIQQLGASEVKVVPLDASAR